jgi:hypothetical protein
VIFGAHTILPAASPRHRPSTVKRIFAQSRCRERPPQVALYTGRGATFGLITPSVIVREGEPGREGQAFHFKIVYRRVGTGSAVWWGRSPPPLALPLRYTGMA